MTARKYAVLAALLLVCGCGESSTASAPTVTVSIPQAANSAGTELRIKEFCYDGTVYLINSNGGMTAKLGQPGATMYIQGCSSK